MRFNELPFKEDLLSFAKYATETIYATDKKSLEKMYKSINKDTYIKIQKIRVTKAQELLENPLLKGLLELYVTGYEATNFNQINEAFTNYYKLQQEYTFQDNMGMYMDAGCKIHPDPLSDSLHIVYPVYLYPAHLLAEGEKDSIAVGGYFKPSRKLTKKEMVTLVKEAPLAFDRNEMASKIIANVLRKYSRM